jgi:hypothetical protein
MGMKMFFKQLLHTVDNEPLETVASDTLGKRRLLVKNADVESVIQERLGNVDDTKQLDPDAPEATALGLLRGQLHYMANGISILGCVLQEQKTNADAVDDVITFAANIAVIEIYHAESTWQQFAVNGITMNIPAGGYRTPIGGTPGATVTIPASVECIVGRLV